MTGTVDQTPTTGQRLGRLTERVTGSKSDDVKGMARGSLLNLVGAGANAVFSFALFAVVARLYDVDEVGGFTVGIAVFTILSTMAGMGAQVGYSKFIPQDLENNVGSRIRRDLTVGLVPVALVGLLTGLVVLVAAPSLASVFGGGENGAIAARHIRWMAPAIPLGAVFLTMTFASQGFLTMKPAVITDRIGRAGLQLLLVIVFVSLGPVGMPLGWSLPYVAGVLVLGWWLVRLVRRHAPLDDIALPSLADAARRFWAFSAPRGLANGFQVAILWTDTILIGAILTTADAGVYSIGTRYLQIGHLAIGAVLQVVAPNLSRVLSKGDNERARTLFRTATRWVVWVVWPMYLGVALFHEPLLGVFGPEYIAAGPSLVVLAGGMMLATASGPVDIALLMSGRSWLSLGNWAGGFTVDVLLCLWLVPQYGIVGAAWAWTASLAFRNLLPLFQVRRLMGIDPFGQGYVATLVTPLLSVGAIGLLIRVVVGSTWTGLALAIVVCAPAHLLLSRVTGAGRYRHSDEVSA